MTLEHWSERPVESYNNGHYQYLDSKEQYTTQREDSEARAYQISQRIKRSELM